MSRRGPGFAPFPRRAVLRVNDLVAPDVELATVRAALRRRGIGEGSRDEPVGTDVRALLGPTAAGTLVTLERRGGFPRPRSVVLRHLTTTLDSLVTDLEIDARSSPKTGQTGTRSRSGGS